MDRATESTSLELLFSVTSSWHALGGNYLHRFGAHVFPIQSSATEKKTITHFIRSSRNVGVKKTA